MVQATYRILNILVTTLKKKQRKKKELGKFILVIYFINLIYPKYHYFAFNQYESY